VLLTRHINIFIRVFRKLFITIFVTCDYAKKSCKGMN